MKFFSLPKFFALGLALASLQSFDSYASESGVIVDVDAKRNGFNNPVSLYLPAGDYKVRAIGPDEGGQFIARNAWNGWVAGCKYGESRCDYGWQHWAVMFSNEVGVSPIKAHPRLPVMIWNCDSALQAVSEDRADGQRFFAFSTPEAALAYFQSVPDRYGHCTFTTDRDGFVSFFDGDRITQDNKGGSSYVIEPVSRVISAQIDIKPGSSRNPLNINGNGKIPVAILGSNELDVSLIDSTTLALAGLEHSLNGQALPMCAPEYSNGDEFLDLVCHFQDDPSRWEPEPGEARLTGALIDGTLFTGTDVFDVVGKKSKT